VKATAPTENTTEISPIAEDQFIPRDTVVCGDARAELRRIAPGSVSCSVWSPPYHVGKGYEQGQTFEQWQDLLSEVIALHFEALKPGGFLVINVNDILCFPEKAMPRLMAQNLRGAMPEITKELVTATWAEHPDYNRRQIAKLLNCSEQTVQRRMEGNNVRGGKYRTQTRVFLVGGMLEKMAFDSSLFLYDRRVWVKDPAWENSKWHSVSYRSVDEFEYLYTFWKPGPTVYDRHRLSRDEWVNWGSRAVWHIPSVQANNAHEAMFPLELPRRVIRMLTDPGETVLDCFMGSGTTAAAAKLEGRYYIGIEKDPSYCELARKQAAKAANGHPPLMKLEEHP
jgi:site-specific DNA-methyltransferase (adenine-specific)